VSREPRWIDRRALLLLHEESLATFGGASGLRDEGLLDSALARPVNRFLYEGADDLAELAAAYCFGIAKNHAFIDGNKRVAFLSIGLFLGLNGKRLRADPVDAVETMLAVAAGQLDEPGLARWIAAHLEPGERGSGASTGVR
jgi:death-on-curing protein